MAVNKVVLSGETLIDLTSDTVTAADVASGKTFHLPNGEQATGTASGGSSGSNDKLAGLVDGSITEITANDLAGATSIREYAFASCDSLVSVNIPDGVTSIGSYAFYNCANLESITLPDSVTSVGEYAFSQCTQLTNITIPDGITTINKYTFYSCMALPSITLPDSVTSIGSYAFYQCRQLKSITIPANVISIANNALQYAVTITMLPTTPPTIQSSTFSAARLNQIIVPAGTGDTYKAATNWANFADYIVEATNNPSEPEKTDII